VSAGDILDLTGWRAVVQKVRSADTSRWQSYLLISLGNNKNVGASVFLYRHNRRRLWVAKSPGESGQPVGLTQVAIANYERGSRKPDVEMVPKLAQLLGASIEELYGGEGRKRAEAPT
jgi:DNA-binding XRE family transcriptional regulator